MCVWPTYAGIPPPAADDEVQNAHVAPQQYVAPSHPVYADGTLCISILVRDAALTAACAWQRRVWLRGRQRALAPCAHRRVHCTWRHLTQLLSVISLLSSDTPNTDSPANIDAAKQVREDPAGYRKTVRRLVRQSSEEAYE